MIADAKNLQVSGKCRYSSWCQLFPTTRRLKPQGFISMCAGESNPTPARHYGKDPDTRPHLQCSRAQLHRLQRSGKKKQHFLHRNFWRLPGRKWESVPIAFGNAKRQNKAVGISMCAGCNATPRRSSVLAFPQTSESKHEVAMTSSRGVLLPVRKRANFMGSKKNGRMLTVTGGGGAVMAAFAPRRHPLQLCLEASQGSH